MANKRCYNKLCPHWKGVQHCQYEKECKDRVATKEKAIKYGLYKEEDIETRSVIYRCEGLYINIPKNISDNKDIKKGDKLIFKETDNGLQYSKEE